MNPDRILVLIFILLCLHVFIVIVTWFEARIRPALVIVGLLDTEAEFLHKVAKTYHKMGINVPPYLLAPPSSIPLAEARLLEKRLILEFIAISIGALIPSGVFIATFGI